eukprot:534288_1
MSGYYQTSYKSKDSMNKLGKEPLLPETQGDLEVGGGWNGFSDQKTINVEMQIRLQFIRKVYSMLTLQIAATVLVSLLCVFIKPLNIYITAHTWPLIITSISSIVMLLVMMFFRRQHPINLLLLSFWTLIEAFTIGVVAALYTDMGQGVMIIQAAGLTLGIFVALTAFTFQSKIDFSFLGAALFVCTFGLVLWGIIMAFVGYRSVFWYSLLGAIVFSLYILFDTSMILRRLSPDEWVMATISLYIDILNLFLYSKCAGLYKIYGEFKLSVMLSFRYPHNILLLFP